MRLEQALAARKRLSQRRGCRSSRLTSRSAKCVDGKLDLMSGPPQPFSFSTEANTGSPLKGVFERMARRRFQDPTPMRRGKWWTIQVRQDVFTGDKRRRSNRRVRLASASMPEREVKKLVAEYLRPLNQGLESIGSATNFTYYVENTYKPVMMPLMAKTTQDRDRSVIARLRPSAASRCCGRCMSSVLRTKRIPAFASSSAT